MKKINSLLTGLLLTASVFLTQQATAQAPQKMSYQSVIRNSSNVLLVNTAVGMKISVLQGSSSGTEAYVETQTATTNANGLVSLQIGTGTASIGTFSEIDWAYGPYFIKTEIDPTGGSNYSITGTQQMASVPYAMYAAKSGGTVFETTIDDPTAIHNTNSGNVGIGTDLPSEKLDVAGNLKVRGNVGIGTETPNTSAALEINSTTGALLLPRMTTAERNNLTASEGMIIYNTSDALYQGYSTTIVNSNPVVDQSQLAVENTLGIPDMSQSFTAGLSGALTSVRVLLNCMMGPQTATIYIRDGAGNSGAILYQSTATINNNDGGNWVTINPSGVNLVAGNVYSINIVNQGGFRPESEVIWFIGADNYSGGNLFWGEGAYGADGVFETTVTPSPTASLQWASLNPSFGGNPAQGKVLTSDDNGTATWQTPASPDLTGYATTATVDNNLTTIQAIIATQSTQMIVLQAQIISLLPTTVLIGTQTWNRKNLNVTTYRDGTPIPEVKDATAWASLTTGAWCHYNNDPANDAIYGKLYNWYAVNNSRGLAPSGFHVPTNTELSAVSDMKNPNGFAGLPGGQRLFNGEFVQIGEVGKWWSSSLEQFDSNSALFRNLNYSNGSVGGFNDSKPYGSSVRCVSN